MSIHIQQQIKNNATEIRDYISDLYDWEESVVSQKNAPLSKQKMSNINHDAPIRGVVISEKSEQNPQLKRDINTVQSYYDAWSKVDVDKLLEDEPIITDVFRQPTQTSANIKIVVKGGRNMVKSSVMLAKEQANDLFKQQQYQEAIEKYTLCVQELNAKLSLNEEELDQLIIVYSNRAQCHLKILDYNSTVIDCNKALNLNHNHQKSLLRRSTAYQELGKWKEALKDCEKLVILGDEDAKNIVNKLQKKMKAKKDIARAQLKEIKTVMADAIVVLVEDQQHEEVKSEIQKNYLNEIDD